MVTGRRSGCFLGLNDAAKNVGCRVENTIVAEKLNNKKTNILCVFGSIVLCK